MIDFRLYTLDGHVMVEPSSLKSMESYVAVGGEVGGFKKLSYGSRKPAFNSSPKRDRKYVQQVLACHQNQYCFTSVCNKAAHIWLVNSP